MTNDEKVKFLFENFYDQEYNKIDLSGLDFTMLNCTLDFSKIKCSKFILNENQEAKTIVNNFSKAENIYQCGQVAKKIEQFGHKAKIIYQQKIDNSIIKNDDEFMILTEKSKRMTKDEIEKILGFNIDIVEKE